jgi:hypothetical protein
VSAEWWRGLPPVEIPVDCGDEQHRLRWEAGELRALDHDDADGERALAALGGERNACIEVLDAWARHRHDLRVLVVTPRGAADTLHLLPVALAGMRQRPLTRGGGIPFVGVPPNQIVTGGGTSTGFAVGSLTTTYVTGSGRRPIVGTAGGNPGMPAQPDGLMSLLALSSSLAARLAAGVAAHWGERLERGEPDAVPARAALVAALYGRAVCAVREWLGEPDVDVELEVVDADRAPGIERTAPHTLAVSMPLDWIWRVWARGLAIVLGRFTLAVTETDDDVTVLLSAGPSITDVRSMTISLGRADARSGDRFHGARTG